MTSDATDSTVLELAAELYAAAPADFTATRDALVREHRGDKELSARIKSLRRPVAAAWLLNALARYDAEQLGRVLELGEALRQAQDTLAGDQLRELTRQRRQLTAAVAGTARGLAVRLGHPVSASVADQVEAGLTSALRDPGAAAAVRSGLLVAVPDASGVGESDATLWVALPEALGTVAAAAATPSPALRAVPESSDAKDERRERELARALAEAEEELAGVEGQVADATQARDEAAARSLQAASELDELRRRVDELEAEAEELAAVLEEREDELVEATDERDEARRRVDEAHEAYERG